MSFLLGFVFEEFNIAPPISATQTPWTMTDHPLQNTRVARTKFLHFAKHDSTTGIEINLHLMPHHLCQPVVNNNSIEIENSRTIIIVCFITIESTFMCQRQCTST